jgi:hypothetical protein
MGAITFDHWFVEKYGKFEEPDWTNFGYNLGGELTIGNVRINFIGFFGFLLRLLTKWPQIKHQSTTHCCDGVFWSVGGWLALSKRGKLVPGFFSGTQVTAPWFEVFKTLIFVQFDHLHSSLPTQNSLPTPTHQGFAERPVKARSINLADSTLVHWSIYIWSLIRREIWKVRRTRLNKLRL